MAEISRFFADVGGDRLNTAAQINRIFDQLLQEKDGVIRGLGNELAVTNSGTLAVDINTGSAIMAGRIYENTASVNKSLDAVTSGSKRYDRIVVRVDETARTMLLTVIKGIEGASPAVPAIDGTTDVLLAKILIDRSSGSYVYTVTDERVYCDGLLLPAIIAILNGTPPTAAGITDSNAIGALTKVANLKLFINAAGTGFEYANGFKVITATHDIATATGTKAITGVGFKPSWAIIIQAVDGSKMFSIGMSHGTSHGAAYTQDGVSADTWSYQNNKSFAALVDANNHCIGYVSSWDSDGATLTLAKTGSPTGTSYMTILFGR